VLFALATSSLNPSRISTETTTGIVPHHAQAICKVEINRRWGLAAAKIWASLLIDHMHISVLGFDDETELGAQARQRQFYYCQPHVRNGHGNGHRPNGRG
jgi:hypothetical protein